MKHLRAAAVLLGLGRLSGGVLCHAAAGRAANATTPASRCGGSICSGRLLLLPDDWLLANWFGSPPQFALADRLPVLLVAGAILAWAAALGWLLLAVCGAGIWPDCASECTARASLRASLRIGLVMPAMQLTRLETFVFATAVGLATLSTWVLLLGLFGLLEPHLDVRRAGGADAAGGGLGLASASGTTADSRRLTAAGAATSRRGLRAGRAARSDDVLPRPLALARPAVCRWRSCWPPCCRRWISTSANTTSRRRRSSTNRAGSPSCRTTSTPTWRWARRCSACWRWSWPAIGGGGRWPARP